MPIIAPDIGIDLGTNNISLYVRGRGVIISEPSIIVLDRDDHRLTRAVGDEAMYMLSRTPEALYTAYPLKNGLISDFDLAELMLRYFIRKAVGISHLVKPRVIVSIPCELDDINRKALTEAVKMAGAKHVFLVEKPFAAALGCGLPVYEPTGNMVVDIGAGTTDIAVLSLGGLVVSRSIPIGGNRINEALIEYLRRECSIIVSSQTAESIKKDLASAIPLEDPRTIIVRGINQLNTSAGTCEFSSTQANEAIKEPCSAILAAVHWVLERTPPELSADIMRAGIHLAGGGASLFALDKMISDKLGLPVYLAKDPEDCTILGIGYLTENIQLVSPQDSKAENA